MKDSLRWISLDSDRISLKALQTFQHLIMRVRFGTSTLILIHIYLMLTHPSVVLAQTKPYTASFIGRLGVDTVLVETYSMINNHLYGKAFIRVPEDYIGEFSIHFYPDGSIREFSVMAMDPFNSSLPFKSVSGAFEFRLNMNCQTDTCTFYNSEINSRGEKVLSHPASKMDFVGGWVPLISLIEWNCIRLIQSERKTLALKMINHNLGVYDIGVSLQNKDTILFGGPFLEYTKIKIDQYGRILSTNGLSTPWSYLVTRHEPIDVVQIASKMARTKGFGIPSPTENISAVIDNCQIEVSYGRPSKRGRTIFGSVVPYDSIWRTGANRPTTITLEKGIKIGKTSIPGGRYSLYTIPGRNEWKLIFNNDLNTWPTDPNRGSDFAEAIIPLRLTDTITEQLTIEILKTKKGGLLKFLWDNVEAYCNFQVLSQ